MSSIARRAGSVALWLVLAVVVVLAFLMVLVPRVTGWVPLTILTGSMEPTIPTGSQVVVQTIDGEADAAKLNIGDVVTFMPHPDDPTLVTHRIVSRTLSSDGSISFGTQGDANSAADSWTLTATQLRGVLQYHVPYAGYLATALDGNQKQTGVGVAATALLAYAVAQLVGAVRERRKSVAAAAPGAAFAAVTSSAQHDVAEVPAMNGETTAVGPANRTVREELTPTRAASTKQDTAARTHGPRHRRDEPARDRELVDAA
ncbi:signal peptidase I [Georgenia yuyongxinii]|uniref:Signal peptidase I n=1 Tax=Georgenia yuyongxinii TaxID=2589797 RepID=A0A5B8BZ81_9MICO|nr:signal peptidase I [Georgenia yuyongxinii]QDC23719.1 signal peptidase I [Georgenia yuyongxinii]